MSSIFGKLFNRPPTTAQAASQFEALFLQATHAAASNDFRRAIELFDQAIALRPTHAEAYYKRGNALKNLGRLDAALASYDQAIVRKPDFAHAYCNRGVVQQGLGLLPEALSSYDEATALDAADARAHYNRALLMQEFCRWDEALASYGRAIAIDPEFSDAQFNRSLALLYQGNFEEGWRAYEWRWKNAHRLSIGNPKTFAQALWIGEEMIEGKRLLLHSEGGLGDTIQFCRYAASVAARGATVFLAVQAPLLTLLDDLDGVSLLLAPGGDIPPFDYHCPLMSLPLALKTTLESIPSAPRYLRSEEKKVKSWRTRLGEREKPRIGLAWSGNPKNPIDQSRSIPLAQWVGHLPRDFHYVCLQKEVRPVDEQILAANSWISKFDDPLHDFSDAAALCECMDLIISVDTSLAHLSGALGKRTWILLPRTPDWRWLIGRADSPWYPTATLYRQETAGDWQEVFARVKSDLQRISVTGNVTK